MRRKRLCGSCRRGFITLERVDLSKVYILSELGAKSAFDRDRLFSSIRKSDKSGSISDDTLHAAVDVIAKSLFGSKKPIPTEELIEKTSTLLAQQDPVVAARFICAHRKFSSIDSMADAIVKISK